MLIEIRVFYTPCSLLECEIHLCSKLKNKQRTIAVYKHEKLIKTSRGLLY